MPGKAMLTAKQRTLPKALQEKIIKAKKEKEEKMKYPDIIGSSDKSLEIIAMEKDQARNCG